MGKARNRTRKKKKTKKEEGMWKVALLCFISFIYMVVLVPNSMQRSEVILLDGCKPQGNPLLREWWLWREYQALLLLYFLEHCVLEVLDSISMQDFIH